MKIVNFDETDKNIQMVGYYVGLVSTATLLVHLVLGDGVGAAQYMDWTQEQRVKRAAKLCKAVNAKRNGTDAATKQTVVLEGSALTAELLASILTAAKSASPAVVPATFALSIVSAD